MQHPLEGYVGGASGTCVKICEVLGLPYVRFRAAVPSEWFRGSVAESIGRKHGLSIEAVASRAQRDQYKEFRNSITGRGSLTGRGSIYSGGGGAADSRRIPATRLDDPASAVPADVGQSRYTSLRQVSSRDRRSSGKGSGQGSGSTRARPALALLQMRAAPAAVRQWGVLRRRTTTPAS